MGRIATQRSENKAVYYSYDSQGRYIGQHQKDPQHPTHEYRYNANGTRIYARTPEGETTARHDEQDRLLRWNNHNFNYNLNGDVTEKINLTTSETTSYVYDVFGNLKSVTLPNSDVIEYKIDSRNRRVLKYKNSVLQVRYVWETQLRIGAQLNAAGEIRRQFLYVDSVNVPDGMITRDGTKYLFFKDARGSVLRVINAKTGTIAQELEYDDWGNVTKDTNPGFQPFGYAGGLYDHETGLVRFGARDYNAVMGRWMSKDPILFAGGDTNLYGYVMQDPINFIDPEGKWLLGLAAGAAGLLYLEFEQEITDFICSLSQECQRKKDGQDRERDVNREVNKEVSPQCYPDDGKVKPSRPNFRWPFKEGLT